MFRMDEGWGGGRRNVVVEESTIVLLYFVKMQVKQILPVCIISHESITRPTDTELSNA